MPHLAEDAPHLLAVADNALGLHTLWSFPNGSQALSEAGLQPAAAT